MSKTYTVYMSNVAGNVISQKNLQRLDLIFTGNQIPYNKIDISLEENATHKQTMIANSKSEKPTQTPQVFLGSTYIADFDKIDEWNEYDELKQNLA